MELTYDRILAIRRLEQCIYKDLPYQIKILVPTLQEQHDALLDLAHRIEPTRCKLYWIAYR